MKQKVLHLISSLAMGGAESLIKDYALKIDEGNFEVVIVTISPAKETINEDKLRKAGIKVVFLGNKQPFPTKVNIFKRVVNKISRYVNFCKTVKEEKPNIIHTHLHTNGYVVPINTKKRDIKLFHTVHNKVNVLFDRVSRTLPTKYCIRYKGMVPITLHSKMQKEVNEFFNIDFSLVVPNAIDIKRFANIDMDEATMLNSFDINKEAFIVGHVGRFTKPKNHKFLIEVFDAVNQKKPSAQLILIGIGELENEIKTQIYDLGLQDNVSFLGSRGDIPELMHIMDVFVFPSLWEGFGNVMIEAQAAGVRCVASDTIPKDAFVTNLITPLSLDDSLETWVNTILHNEKPNKIKGDLYKHDINNVIKEIESIYLEATGG